MEGSPTRQSGAFVPGASSLARPDLGRPKGNGLSQNPWAVRRLEKDPRETSPAVPPRASAHSPPQHGPPSRWYNESSIRRLAAPFGAALAMLPVVGQPNGDAPSEHA